MAVMPSEDLATRMEAMFQQYSVRFGDFNPRKTDPFEVYLFSKRKDYLTLTDNRASNTGGISPRPERTSTRPLGSAKFAW